MKTKTKSLLMNATVRLAQAKAAEGYALPAGYAPQNREQRRDLQRAMRKRK
jgi:hypothetical protein